MQVDTVTPSGPVAAALLGLPHIRGLAQTSRLFATNKAAETLH